MRADAFSAPAAKLLSKIEAMLGNRTEIVGCAKLWAKPGYQALLYAEKLIKQTVPVLILVFLIVAAAFRLSSLMQERVDLKESASRDLRIASALMHAEAMREDLASERRSGADLLTSAMPKELVENGRFALIVDGAGIVRAATPGHDHLMGDDLSVALGQSQALLMFGQRAGVQSTQFHGEPALVSAATLGEGGETMVFIQRERELLADWQRTVSRNVAMFAVTSIVMLLTLYAFFRQASRAETADVLYLQTHRRVDTALTRGRCGLWDWDIARGRMYWSCSMYEMLGLAPQDSVLAFGDVADLMHPDDGDLFDVAREVANGRITSIDRVFRMRRHDGTYLWLRARAEICREIEGEIHLIGVAVDISEQQELARLSNEASRQLHDAVENISETFVLCDAKDHVILCNSKYRETFGLAEQDVRRGAALHEVLRHARKPIETHIVTSPTFAEGERASEALLPDGRWLLMSERRTSDGGFVSIGTDVTQLKLQESRLSDTERRLLSVIDDLTRAQREAVERSRQLSQLNESYAAEKERAETASRAKTTFLANMSHELRTPLNAILGFSEIMREGTFGPMGNEKYCEYTDDIHKSGLYLLRLINDILDMAKIEAGRMVLSPEEVDLASLLAEAKKIVALQAEEKEARVELEIPETLLACSDRRATKQVMLNLLSNAVKFVGQGGTIRVRAKEVGGRAFVLFSDDGIGIPKEAVELLGRPFEQVENELTRTNKGTGLGLAIARSLVELHGGRMRISSEQGVGTVVAISLPLDGTAVTNPGEEEQRAAA